MGSGVTPPLRVAVIGSGIAGLACALAVARAGASVQVFDARGGLPDVPAHVVIVPNMLRDLVALGVADDCLRLGFPYLATRVLDAQGQLQFSIGTERLAGPRYPAALGITHSALVKVLAAAAAGLGVTWQWNAPVHAIDVTGTRPRLRHGESGTHEADLVLLAAGAASPLRRRLFDQLPWRAALAQEWWYLLAAQPVAQDGATMVMGRAGHKVIVVPVSAQAYGLAMTRPAPAQSDADRAVRGADWRAGVGPLPDAIASIVRHVADDTPVVVRPVRGEILPAPWHHGAVLCVGECAHAMPPQFGQAAAQAVEDALVLHDLLKRGTTVHDIGANYTARRQARVRHVFDTTWQAARWDAAPECDTDLRALAGELARTVAVPA